tara:strand:- start:3872 stop:4084 length:213 start_codon:yes stop_codon:yes gene_type:complete
MFSALLRLLARKKSNPVRFFVESDEPFERELIMRGPFSRKDAQDFLFVNGACGSKDRLYEDVGGGVLVPR